MRGLGVSKQETNCYHLIKFQEYRAGPEQARARLGDDLGPARKPKFSARSTLFVSKLFRSEAAVMVKSSVGTLQGIFLVWSRAGNKKLYWGNVWCSPTYWQHCVKFLKFCSHPLTIYEFSPLSIVLTRRLVERYIKENFRCHFGNPPGDSGRGGGG